MLKKYFWTLFWPLLCSQLIFLTAVADAQPTTHRSFDAYGHRSSLESPLGGVRTYDHNYQGIERSASLNGQSLVYDAVFGDHGKLEEYVYDSVAGAPARRAEYGYDGLGRPKRLALETPGQPGADAYSATDFNYNERSFITSYQRADSSVGTATVGFDYDFQGMMTGFHWGSQSVSYVYDESGNLQSRSGGLGIDALGPVNYDTDNHRAGWLYDARGRLLRDDRHTYEYNERGRVRLIREIDSGQWVAHYLYDTSGRRVRVLEPDQVTYSYRDGQGVIAEEVRGSDHEITKEREHVTFAGRQVHTRTTLADGTVEPKAQFTDRLGNPVFSWDGGKSTVHEYSPFGQALAVGSSQPHEGAYGFTGHEDDGSTGLTYMQARYYDSDAARFNRPDPARDVDATQPSSYNLYQYSRSNPANFVDPDGQAVVTTLLAVHAAASTGADLFDRGHRLYWRYKLYGAEDFKTELRAELKGAAVSTGINLLTRGAGKALEKARGLFSRAKGLFSRGQKSTKIAESKVQTLEQRAADLVARNGGKNRVSIKTPNGRVNIDLQGKDHGGVPTPHVATFKNNIIPSGDRAGQVGNRSQVGPVRSATAADLRIVDRLLKSREK